MKLLQQETPHFIGNDLWLPISPGMSPVDYKVWGVMQYRTNSVNELKQRLTEIWNSPQQNVIDVAISEWRKRPRACMRAD